MTYGHKLWSRCTPVHGGGGAAPELKAILYKFLFRCKWVRDEGLSAAGELLQFTGKIPAEKSPNEFNESLS